MVKNSKRPIPSRMPHDARDGSWWWYENRGSVDVYVKAPTSTGTAHARIPWRQLLAAARRLGLCR